MDARGRRACRLAGLIGGYHRAMAEGDRRDEDRDTAEAVLEAFNAEEIMDGPDPQAEGSPADDADAPAPPG